MGFMGGLDVASGIFAASEVLLKLLKRIKITYQIGGVKIDFLEEEKPIDERISKIDDARTYLTEVLSAIDELHNDAERNKKELKEALGNLSEVEKNKDELERELTSIREVIKSDVGTFRKLAGIPSKEDIKKERAIGFFTGVLASIVASGLIWIGVTFGKQASGYFQKRSGYSK